MRFWELYENTGTTLYHGSRKELPVNTILTPQVDGYAQIVDDEDGVGNIEEIMEQTRPKNMLSRKDSVFMVADPNDIDPAGGYIDYIYIVEPLGRVEKNNMGWYSNISGFEDTDEHKERAFNDAKNYWNGVDYPNGGLWEYRSRQAKIIEVFEVN